LRHLRRVLQLKVARLSDQPALPLPSTLAWERLPRQWKKSFVSHHVVRGAIAPVEERCSGAVV